jgi:folate-binding protein YgfZ
MDAAPIAISIAHGALARLDHLGVLAVTGADAPGFLHNQLTNDVQNLGLAEARLVGYCSAKGRLLATGLLWRTGEGFWIAIPKEILGAIQKRLSLFVLRQRVKIADASQSVVLYGLTGSDHALEGFIPALGAKAKQANQGVADTPPTYLRIELAGASALALPPALGLARWLLAATPDLSQVMAEALSGAGELDAAQWRWLDVRAGLPWITATTQDRFVPQMLNFELLGGVNFQKGCYPGQEVVARSQYLGKIKRRTILAHSAVTSAPAPGGDVYHSSEPDVPLGTIVTAEASMEGGVDLLVEIPQNLPPEGTLHLGRADGPLMTALELPYALSQNEVFVRPKL